MPSNHLILCLHLLLPSIFPSIRVFSNESALRIRWTKYWSFSFSISPSSEHSESISVFIYTYLCDYWHRLATPITNQQSDHVIYLSNRETFERKEGAIHNDSRAIKAEMFGHPVISSKTSGMMSAFYSPSCPQYLASNLAHSRQSKHLLN